MNMILLSIVIISLISVSLIKYSADHSYERILIGISLESAQKTVNQNEIYYIVKSQQGATGAGYVIEYGKNQSAEIELSGNSPDSQLSNVFFLSKMNMFLIKSTGNIKNPQNLGALFNDAYPNISTIEVDMWEIIVPIKRDYQYRLNGQKSRLFSPKKYIDQFDLQNGDYYW